MSVRSAFSDLSDPQHGVIKSRIAGTLLAFIVLVLFVLANLPYQYVESETEWVGYLEVADGGSYRAYKDLPTMAGWPLRYWIRYVDEDEVQDRFWLPSRLLLNLTFGIVLAACVYLFVQFRRRKLNNTSGSRRAQLAFDCGVALVILLVPGSIFMWEYRNSSYHRRIARDLERVGSSCLSCWLPAPYSEHVPAGLRRQFVRIRQAHVYGARQSTANVVTSLPTLASFHSYAGEYDSQPLKRLLDNPHFCVLQLNRRELSHDDLEVIRRLQWLDQLRISRTSIDADQLRFLDALKLKVVDLSFTNVELSRLGRPGWSSTVESLFLSRPADGIETRLVIEGWPKLRNLEIERQSEFLNDAVLRVELIDLPRLERMHIDRVQKHDLVLRNVPRLERIDEGVSDLRYVLNSDMLIPGLTWLRSLEIDGADSLTNFGCFARDLQDLSIRRTPSLRKLSLGSFLSTLLGQISPQDVDPARCDHWLEQIGKMDGPSELDLAYLPLDQEDLSPLCENNRIRHLNFNGSDITFAQVRQLAGMGQLESLVIPSTPMQEDELVWVLDHFPAVKNLTLDTTSLTQVDLRGRDQLRDVRLTPMGSLCELRIVDLPNLRTSIRVTQPPEVLEIRNVPSLRGLAVEGPWPLNAELSGLRDLEWFTGGGVGIDDQILNEILRCDSIDRLSLAYPAVSAQALRRIGKLKELTFLALPGADVDDDVVRDWRGLTALWEVNLDDTAISAETIAWLSRIESLRRLSINRVPMNDVAADALAELHQVSELYLSGVSISHSKLHALLKLGSLETLDLSGWKFDDNLIEILCADGAALKHLIVHDSEIDESMFDRLLAGLPTLYIDMGDIPDFVDRASLEELHRRAQALRREMNTGWRLMLRPRDDVYQSPPTSSIASEFVGPPQTLGMPSLPVSYMSQLNRQLFTPDLPAGN